MVLGVVPIKGVPPNAGARSVSAQSPPASARHSTSAAAQPVRAADRCARAIGAFLKSFLAARSRRLTHSTFGVRGKAIAFLLRFGYGVLGFLKARSANSVVPTPVVQAWYERPLCWKLVVQGVVRTPVVLRARCGQRDRMLGVLPDQGPLCRA